jgi:hypothetical protein
VCSGAKIILYTYNQYIERCHTKEEIKERKRERKKDRKKERRRPNTTVNAVDL